MSKGQINLKKTVSRDDIELGIEYKLLGLKGLLDGLSYTDNGGFDNISEAFAFLRDSIDGIIRDEIEPLKEKTEYMFGICSQLYHYGEVHNG